MRQGCEKEQVKGQTGKDARKCLIMFLVIWVAQMAAAFYFCTQKQGFHEDEYYTYYATARTNGFYVEDGQWMDRETYFDEFVVLPDQRFQYGLVKLVQSWDVHPPMYYWVFHTVQSLTPNVFSKWTGLSVNLFFHGINIILLTALSYLVSGRDKKLSLFVTIFYGFTPAAMSGVVFIRMYEMLTTMVLLCAILHVRAVQTNERKLSVGKYLVPMALVTYVGFLTQYYYFIFLFYVAIAFGVWMLWRDRNLWNCVRYGIAQGSALILAYLTYPSCLGQMFRGQRGAQATKSFFDLSNTLERFWFFGDLMSRFAFGHLFFIGLILALLLAVTVRRRSKRVVGEVAVRKRTEQDGKEFWMLIFAAVGYFLTVAKTALLLGETSNRYQLPIYGIVVLLLVVGIRELWRRVIQVSLMPKQRKLDGDTTKHFSFPAPVTILLFLFELLGDLWRIVLTFVIKHRKYTGYVMMALCLVTVGLSLHYDGVLFLYPEDQEQTAFAEECASKDIPVIYLYKKGEEWCIWDVANELFAYSEVYFVEAKGEELITDERIQNADELVVYLSNGVDDDEQTMRVAASSRQGIDGSQRIFSEKYCSVQYFFRE